MDAIVERACGLDVHQASVVACVKIGAADKRACKQTRTFGTTTKELGELFDWLKELGVTHVGMESTGVYWMPVYTVLEGTFELVVGNAAHIKNVPGRKTDMKDAEWLAELVRHGLIRKSFVPPPWQRGLRQLTRYRRKLVESQVSERNRLMKLLEICGIKLSSVASNVFGVSGRAMVRALIEGTATPEEIANLAKGTLRKKTDRLRLALEGQLDEERRFLLELQLERVERIEADICRVDTRIDAAIVPHQQVYLRLMQIPGVDRITAVTIIAELGTDTSVFPTAGHAAAWAGVSPGNCESAGKRLSHSKRRDNVFLATALVQAALAGSRKKGSYMKEKFWRLKARRGHKRAAVALAHHILVAAYHMLRESADYKELGPGYLDKRSEAATKRKLVKRLESLGYEVSLKPAA